MRLDFRRIGIFIRDVPVMQYFADTVVELRAGAIVMPWDTSANVEEGGSQGFIQCFCSYKNAPKNGYEYAFLNLKGVRF